MWAYEHLLALDHCVPHALLIRITWTLLLPSDWICPCTVHVDVLRGTKRESRTPQTRAESKIANKKTANERENEPLNWMNAAVYIVPVKLNKNSIIQFYFHSLCAATSHFSKGASLKNVQKIKIKIYYTQSAIFRRVFAHSPLFDVENGNQTIEKCSIFNRVSMHIKCSVPLHTT